MESNTIFQSLNIAEERAYPTPYSNSPVLALVLFSLMFQKHAPVKNVKKSVDELKDEYDYIVVGAGSAGSVVASRLSEESCVSVLLLEAGKTPPRLTDVPAIARSFIETDLDWQYLTTPQKYTGAGHTDRKVSWPSGRCLGGSSSINAMIYVRGNRRNYDEWARMGAEGWSYKECLPYFKKLENNDDPRYVASGYHARGGPITASRSSYYPIKKRALMKAIRDERYRFVNSNGEDQPGFYDFQASHRGGQRNSVAKGYLAPADNRTNFDILTEALVRKVQFNENKTAVGVEFDFDGETYQVKARREVIMSAGTTNTAQLLMLSGIGLRSELSKHNISVIQELPVGKNLQDHQASFISYLVDQRLPRFENEVRGALNTLVYAGFKRGPLTSPEGIYLMSFLSNKVNGTRNIPDHSVYFADFVDKQFMQGNLNEEMIQKVLLPIANKSIITCAVQLLRPRSRGTVTLLSADPRDPPVIDPNYYEHPQDMDDMIQGLDVCQKILENRYMKRIGARAPNVTIPGCEAYVSDDKMYKKCIAETIVFTTNHQTGTAKMGSVSDPTTVVDPELRVKGIRGLRVVDASIMPTVPWSNTNIPSIMVGEKGADIIKETINCERKPY